MALAARKNRLRDVLAAEPVLRAVTNFIESLPE